MKNLTYNILLFLGSVVFTFSLAEVLCRLFMPAAQIVETKYKKFIPQKNPRNQVQQDDGEIGVVFDWGQGYGSRLKPNIEATIINHRLNHETIKINTNSLGLRHSELGPKQIDEYRILVLGDSITIGDFLNYSELYTTKLESLLKKESTKKITVINAGIPGASTFDEFYHYLEIKDQVKADLVLIGMYLNDVSNSQKIYIKTLKSPYSESRLLSWLYSLLQQNYKKYFSKEIIPEGIDKNWAEDFRAGRNLKSGSMYEDREAFDFEIYNASMDFGLAWNEKSWKILNDIIHSFRDIVSAEKSELKMFLFPVHLQVFGNVKNYYPQEQFLKLCNDLSVSCLDLRPALAKAGQKYGRRMYYDHCHFGPEANQVVAEAISDWLLKSKTF